MRDTSPLIKATNSNVNPRRVYGAWLRDNSYKPYTNYQQLDRMSQMEVICTNFVMHVLQFSHRCTIAYTIFNEEREREPYIGVNKRHFTLDQSRKLEWKPKTGLQSMHGWGTRPSDCALIIEDSIYSCLKWKCLNSHSIAQQLNIILYICGKGKPLELQYLDDYSWRKIKFDYLPAHIFSYEPLRASERAMKSFAITQSSSIWNAEVLGDISIHIHICMSWDI